MARPILAACALAAFSFILAADAPLAAQQVALVPHDINPASEFPACAVLDVNKDGQLDIASGGFWYEAPAWKKHFLREVEIIRGRYDDYSNLEMDVNADGWMDLISVNYRSASIFWIEHPGEAIRTNPDTPWKKHLVDNPGPMETGRLYDIDGDGRLDILPNGTTFAAWYELVRDEGSGFRGQGSGPEPGVGGQKFRNPQSAIRNPQSAVRNPQSAVRNPQFLRHDLPLEIAGHGVGFGDINGDGRGDIVGPHGWLEAPEDRRNGRWLWHPDWDLTRDASIPILVHDVDGDGDNDLIWGRGHRFGLYWLENGGSLVAREGEAPADPSKSAIRKPQSAISWTWRAIDTSWAQPHSIFLADLDGDRKPELVAGKRYLGHEGKDPGEYDLLCAYYYCFDPKLKTWSRNEIYFNHRAGFGLDPRAADIDGDGDIDLVAADRCSLCLLKNSSGEHIPAPDAAADSAIRQSRAEITLPELSPTWKGAKYNHSEPLAVIDGESHYSAKSPAEFALRGHDIRSAMQVVMGVFPQTTSRVALNVRVEAREDGPDYTRIKLTYAAEPGDRVPAILLVPKEIKLNADGITGELPQRDEKSAASNRGFGKRLPAMLCLHQTNRDGKAQPAGLIGPPAQHYGHELAQRGFVCLVPDYPSFGDYKSYDFHQKSPGSDKPLYESGSMKAIWNNIRAVDLLESLGYADIDNIGVIGHSLGGHNALFTAVFEPRLKAVVTSCGFTAFHDYMKGDLKGWTSDRYMPKIRDVFGNNPDKMPFDFPEVLAAIAPRGIYVNAPLHDSNFDVGGVKKCIAAAAPVFELLGGKKNLVVEYPDCGHDFPDDVRERVYRWLEKQLQ